MPDTTRCRTCKRQWNSLSQCHCTGCHLHFSGISTFDAHLIGSVDHRRCRTADELLTGKPKTTNRTLRKIIAPRPEAHGDVWRYADHRPAR